MEDATEQARQHFLDGVAHFEARRLAQARDSFEAALRLAPGRVSVLGNLGVTLFQLGLPAQAIPVLQQAVAAEADYADGWIALGLAQQSLEQWAAASESLTRGLELGPPSPTLWLVCGQCRSRTGLVALALEAVDQALALDPNRAEAWSAKGDLLRQMYRRDEAAACFERAIALGADADLHRFYLASVRDGTPLPRPPRKYVEGLFDGYAADFQAHVVGQLRYQGHERLLRPLLQTGRRYSRVLDLGCGTGLCGQLLQPVADEIRGVDVSGAMLEEARRSGVYRELVHADLATFLARDALRAELVIAADVFDYVGDLDETFAAVRCILEPGGRFAFTVEASPDGLDLCLLPSLRYAHSQSYIETLARRHGFVVESLFSAPLRDDALEPVLALYAILC